MTRRGVIAGAALAVAVATTTLSGPATAEGIDDSCATALPTVTTGGGTIGGGDTEDWWRQLGVPGYYGVTLTSSAADAALSVGDGACGSICGGAVAYGVVTCFVHSASGGVTVGVTSGAKLPAPYALTIAFLLPADTAAACFDRADNDGDGLVDYPADAGCAGPYDMTEDFSPCFRASPAAPETCVEVVTGAQRERYSATRPADGAAEVAGRIEMYRFPLLANVEIPCVVVYADPPGTSVSPCRKAGGRRSGRAQDLFRIPRDDVPDLASRDELVVRVCEAVVNASVDGRRLPPADVLTLC